MKLQDWLKANAVSQSRFAKRIKTEQPYISLICRKRIWPSHNVMLRIIRETKGAVRPEDFLRKTQYQTSNYRYDR